MDINQSRSDRDICKTFWIPINFLWPMKIWSIKNGHWMEKCVPILARSTNEIICERTRKGRSRRSSFRVRRRIATVLNCCSTVWSRVWSVCSVVGVANIDLILTKTAVGSTAFSVIVNHSNTTLEYYTKESLLPSLDRLRKWCFDFCSISSNTFVNMTNGSRCMLMAFFDRKKIIHYRQIDSLSK